MSREQDPQAWERARAYLIEKFPNCEQASASGPLTFYLDDEDWLLELAPDGLLACQSGYDLDDMKSVLSDGTAEDLGSDELAKQAKFYLQQTISKYKPRLQQDGLTERLEMNEEYVAIMFERTVDLGQLEELERTIRGYQTLFSSSA